MKQGDVIEKAGNNVYQSTLKKHLHFIVSIDDKTVNPDKYFNQKLKKLRQHHDKFIFIKKLVSFVFLPCNSIKS